MTALVAHVSTSKRCAGRSTFAGSTTVPFEQERSGAAHHRVTFRGTLAEWSLDALGWLAAFLADVSSRQGVSTPLLFTAGRSSQPGPSAG